MYEEAARLVRSTLAVDGALVLDISSFELVETTDESGTVQTAYQVDSFTASSTGDDENPDRTPGRDGGPQTFLERANSSGPLPALPVLGASEASEPPEGRTQPIEALEHHKLAHWLKEFPDGQIYDRVPSFLRQALPKGIQWCMCVPVFNIDKNPFSLGESRSVSWRVCQGFAKKDGASHD